MELATIVSDFAVAIAAADATRPVAVNQRSKVPFLAGIGPFSETRATELVFAQLAAANPNAYGTFATNVPYQDGSRKRCDVCLGTAPEWDWCVEVKLLRLLGDNGKLNDNMLMHILSPYAKHRSATTDSAKLLQSGLSGRKAIIIYGFSHEQWPLEPAIDAFEALVGARHVIGPRHVSRFEGLVHPVHSEGAVFGWVLEERA